MDRDRGGKRGPPTGSRLRWSAALLSFILTSLISVGLSDAATVRLPTPITSLEVQGNQLVGTDGSPLELLGVNRSGSEYACVGGTSVFDGPTGSATVAKMRSWSINAVRVPLNEDCWLGVNVPRKDSGAVYRSAIVHYVARLRAAGLAVILDLHWSAPGASVADGQEPMPDATHAVAFWRGIASVFKSTPGVAFELFNEPHGVTWQCWVSGCTMPAGWRAVGMQRLIDTVRQTGATQPIIVDGLGWANNLFGWLSHPLVDPLHQLVAAFHVYPWSGCVASTCWRDSVGEVAMTTPVIATEVGEDDCSGSFARTFLHWAVEHGVSALVWTWNDNQACLSLLKGPNDAPTEYGSTIRRFFQQHTDDPLEG